MLLRRSLATAFVLLLFAACGLNVEGTATSSTPDAVTPNDPSPSSPEASVVADSASATTDSATTDSADVRIDRVGPGPGPVATACGGACPAGTKCCFGNSGGTTASCRTCGAGDYNLECSQQSDCATGVCCVDPTGRKASCRPTCTGSDVILCVGTCNGGSNNCETIQCDNGATNVKSCRLGGSVETFDCQIR